MARWASWMWRRPNAPWRTKVCSRIRSNREKGAPSRLRSRYSTPWMARSTSRGAHITAPRCSSTRLAPPNRGIDQGGVAEDRRALGQHVGHHRMGQPLAVLQVADPVQAAPAAGGIHHHHEAPVRTQEGQGLGEDPAEHGVGAAPPPAGNRRSGGSAAGPPASGRGHRGTGARRTGRPPPPGN